MWERKTTHMSSLAGNRTVAPLPHGVPQIKGLTFNRSHYVESIGLEIQLCFHYAKLQTCIHRNHIYSSWLLISQPRNVFSEEFSTTKVTFILSSRTYIADARCFLLLSHTRLSSGARIAAQCGTMHPRVTTATMHRIFQETSELTVQCSNINLKSFTQPEVGLEHGRAPSWPRGVSVSHHGPFSWPHNWQPILNSAWNQKVVILKAVP